MALDLESLRLLAWVLLGVALIGMALFEGLTLGVLALMSVLGGNEEEKRQIANSIAPTGLVGFGWLLLLVTLLFGAWPVAYAVLLADLYWLWLPVLLTMIFRPLALFFLEGFSRDSWRNTGYKLLAAGGVVPALVLGLMAGNCIRGIPFHLDSDMRILFLGDVVGLCNPFAVLVMLTALSLLAMHGAIFLQLKMQSELKQRAQDWALRAAALFLLLFAVGGLWITHLDGYHISSDILPNAVSNPLAKFVKRGEGLWLDNYEHLPVLWGMPGFAFAAAATALWAAKIDKVSWAMAASSICITMVVLTFGVSIFPFLLPSNLSLNSSMTIWDASASLLTLQTVVGVAVFALPIIFLASRWGFCLPCNTLQQSAPAKDLP